MKYTIEEETLTALGDAIRNKIYGFTEFDNVIVVEDVLLQYMNAIPHKLPDYVKKVRITGTTNYGTGRSSVSGIQGLGVAPGSFSKYDGSKVMDTEGFVVLAPHTSRQVEDKSLYNISFEIVLDGNEFAFGPTIYSSSQDSFRISYQVVGLDEQGRPFKYSPLDMVELINILPEMPEEEEPPEGGDEIVLTGSQTYGCSGLIASNYIKLFGHLISTSDITNCQYMFQNYKNENIPFDINCKVGNNTDANNMFYNTNLTTLPRVLNLRVGAQGPASMFSSSKVLIEIPDDFCDTWDWSYLNTLSYGNGGGSFDNCYSLRRITPNFLRHCYNPQTSTYASCYRNLFSGCYALDEIKELVVPPVTYSSNMFDGTFRYCERLKTMLFETNEDGTPKTANWKSQTVDLSNRVGYALYGLDFTNYATLPADKEVKDDATYQALKDDPDYWTIDINYSRYNKASAVNTINSLPDCSAYGTNTIKFKGQSGALTDGGAINTMTEEEIAVAAAKGWTVTFV